MPIYASLHGEGRLAGVLPIRATERGSVFQSADWLDAGYAGGWFGAVTNEVMARHPIVDACLRKHADAESAIALKTYDQRSKERQERVDGKAGEFADLLRDGLHGGHHRVREWVAFERRQNGVAHLVLDRDDRGRVRRIYPASALVIAWDRSAGVWRLHGSSMSAEFADRDVLTIPYRLAGSANVRTGVSPVSKLADMIGADKAIAEALKHWWQRGARPGTILRHPNLLSDKARDNLYSSFNAGHGGSGNAGRTVLLEEGTDVTLLPFDAKSAEVIATRKALWDEACIATDTAPQMIHRHEHSTYSNIREATTGWYRDVVAPKLLQVQDDWMRLAEKCGVTEVFVEYDMNSVLYGTPLDRAEILKSADHLTVNEKRAIDTRPAVEGGDRVMVNGANVPLDRMDDWTDNRTKYDATQTGAGSTGAQSPAKTPNTPWSQSDVDQITGRLARAKSLAEIDVDKTVSGVADHVAESFGALLAVAHDVPSLRRLVGAVANKEIGQ